MIVEITDIPEGRLIENITIDIRFEDGVKSDVRTSYFSETKSEPEIKPMPETYTDDEIEEGIQKESNIPDEMKNSTF